MKHKEIEVTPAKVIETFKPIIGLTRSADKEFMKGLIKFTLDKKAKDARALLSPHVAKRMIGAK